ncbi:MAG: hypothetical protein P0107_02305 [Nitrosomonas sp.]|nr:hypothetical protein [Nitrosomonas sp.]
MFFHLHAHQWLSSTDKKFRPISILTTIALHQGFSYGIMMAVCQSGPVGETVHQTLGRNRNTVGDSIFHCHLYSHFAQGMWSCGECMTVSVRGIYLTDKSLKPISTRSGPIFRKSEKL